MRNSPHAKPPDPLEPKVGFDERLWPINCLLFVLSGIVIGLVLGTSRFDDPRILYNAAFRLAIVLIGIGALFFAVSRLRERMVRRVQLCVLISLLVHLGLGVYLHYKYLELKEHRQDELVAEMAEDYEFETIPDYDWERLERPETEEAFEKPLDVHLPDGKQGQTTDRTSLAHEIHAKNRQPAQPEEKVREMDPLQPQRATLSAPRRAEDAGSRLSRQELLRELNPDTPIPQPQVERPAESHASTPTSDAAKVARRAPGSVSTQRRVMEDQPRRESPRRAVAMSRRASEQKTPEKTAPSPTRSQPVERNVAQSRIAETDVALRDDPLLLRESAAAEPARHTPAASAKQPLDRPLPTAGEELRRPAARARRAVASTTDAPNVREQAAEAESLARAEKGATLPSTAVEVPSETIQVAARGSTPASSLEVSSQTAVVRSTRQAAQGRRNAAAGSADFAVGSSRTEARIGRRRATGRDAPSINTATAESGIARARNGMTTLPDHASLIPAPSAAASAEQGAGGNQLAIAPGRAARSSRGGARSLPVHSAPVGAGPGGAVGTPGRVALADRRKTSRFEAVPSGFSGGGTLLPQRVPGRNLTMEATAEPVDIASTAPTGAGQSGTPTASRLAGGPQRHVSGLPGTRKTVESPGADLAFSERGASRAQAPARRDLASQRDGRGTAESPSEASTLARSDQGVRLPSAAQAAEDASETGAGGLGMDQGGLASSLDIGSRASVRRAASDARLGRKAIANATADAGVGSEVIPVSLGRRDTQGHTGAVPEFTAVNSPLGRSLSGAALPVAAEVEGVDTGATASSEASASDSLSPGSLAGREGLQGRLPSTIRSTVETHAGDDGDAMEVATARIDRADEIGQAAPTVGSDSSLASLSRTRRGGHLPSLADDANAKNIGVGDPNADSTTYGELVVLSPGDREPSRRRGGLPVHNSAELGPGGLSRTAGRDVGIPGRRAREESLLVHATPRRFLLERSGMRPTLDATAAEPTEFFRRRDPDARKRWVEQFGGSPATERAVEMGLDYLAREQFEDGRWCLNQSPNDYDAKEAEFGQMSSDTAATGLALLSFFGAGYTHLGDKHRDTVRAGVDWLVEHQRKDGSLFTGGSDYVWLYSHGIATIALCEAYGMTRDPALREPAQRAIGFIVRAQNKSLGGWRYQPGEESDTSVSGWQLMAMKSAQMAGLQVPKEALARTGQWLDGAQADGGSRYMYNPYAADTDEQRAGRSPNLAMTAEGLLMRLYMGWSGSDERVTAGADHLLRNLPEMGAEGNSTRDAYYWYYATQVMFHIGGDYWTVWNERLRPLLETSQTQDGAFAGSWSTTGPVRDRWGHAGGRHYVTTMHLLMLEVYYRHLPLFQTGVSGNPEP